VRQPIRRSGGRFRVWYESARGYRSPVRGKEKRCETEQ
jgi:hypothetical protein